MSEITNNNQPQQENTTRVLGNDYTIPNLVNEGVEKKIDGMSYFSGVTFIGIGQGGSNVAQKLEQELRKYNDISNIILINSAKSDLEAAVNVPDKCKYLISDGSGAGKKREYAKNIFYNPANQDQIFNKIVEENKGLLFGPNRIVIVVFSAGGGTGSAIGPKFVMKLTRYCKTTNEDYMIGIDDSGIPLKGSIEPFRPNVIGLCLSPDYKSDNDSGADTITNALECMKEINIGIKNKLGSYFIIENKISPEVGLYDKINEEVAMGFKKFIKYLGISANDTILDVKDRFVALSNPGLMAFADLDGGTYGTMQPVKGSTILTVASELVAESNDHTTKLNKFKKLISNYIVSDNTIGWNDLSLLPPNEKSNPIRNKDIVLLSGFNNLEVIMENMKETLDRILYNMKNKELTGKAFNDLDDIKNERNNERALNTELNIDEII